MTQNTPTRFGGWIVAALIAAYAAVMSLGEFSEPAQTIGDGLRSKDTSERFRALRYLERMPQQALAPEVEKMLADRSQAVRTSAAVTLSRMNNVSSMPLLFDAIEAGRLDRRGIKALSEIGAGESIPYLERLMQSRNLETREDARNYLAGVRLRIVSNQTDDTLIDMARRLFPATLPAGTDVR